MKGFNKIILGILIAVVCVMCFALIVFPDHWEVILIAVKMASILSVITLVVGHIFYLYIEEHYLKKPPAPVELTAWWVMNEPYMWITEFGGHGK